MCRVYLFVNIIQKFANLKFNFVFRDKEVGTSTEIITYCVVPNGTKYTDCNSDIAIYLITCDRSSLHFAGETIQKLNKSFNWHRTGFTWATKFGFGRMLSDIVHKGICRNATNSF